METNLAVLIDFENIAAGTEKEGLGRFDIDALMARAKDKGRILVARSYADWGRFARFKQTLLANNVTMYELTSHGMQDKNRADIAMVVDCLELAFTRDYVETFIIVSGDSDFTPLVLKLRELRKRVIGIGTRRSTSRLLINACDEFIFYDSIVEKQSKPKRRRPKQTKLTKDVSKAVEFLVDVVEGLMREDPTPPLASIVKTAMLRRRPDFSETDLGFGSFTRFLEAAREAGEVTLSKDKKSGTYAVDTVEDAEDDGPTEVASPAEGGDARRSGPRSTGKKRADGPYDDPFLPEGTGRIVDALHAAGVCPLSHPTRMAVLEQLVEVVADRSKRRQRTTGPIVADALTQRLRRTHPELDKGQLESFIKGMREADLLMHKDGKPIRRAAASFELDRDAEALNRKLAEHYVRLLKGAGVDLSDSARLAAFLLGDPERSREAEEIVAWSVSAPVDDLDDVDALLSLDDGPAEEVEDEARPPRRKPKAKPAEPAETTDGDVPDLDDADIEAILDDKADDKAGDDSGDDVGEPAEKPKKKRPSRRRKKPAEAAEGDAPAADSAPADADDLDALLSVDDD